MPTPRKKNRKRKGKSGTPPTTPENCGKRQYRRFSPTPTTQKLREPLISCAAIRPVRTKSTKVVCNDETKEKEEEEEEEKGNSRGCTISKAQR
jgi:hypothetical protein